MAASQIPLINMGWQRPEGDADSYCTPREILEPVERFSPVVLDPFSNPGSLVNARESWDITHGEATFTESWQRGGLVWVNWPFSINDRCAGKVASEGASGVEIIALCQAYVNAGWWQDHVATADVICAWSGRIRFVGAPTQALFHVVLAAWTHRPQAFINHFSAYGRCFSPRAREAA